MFLKKKCTQQKTLPVSSLLLERLYFNKDFLFIFLLASAVGNVLIIFILQDEATLSALCEVLILNRLFF